MLKAIITDYEYANVDLEKELFQKAGIELVTGQWKKPEELKEVVADMDGIITQYADMNREVIEKLQHCKIIIKYGIGINNIDVDAATEKGIYVCNIPDYGVDEVTNHAIAFMFALMRKLYVTDKDIRNGIWDYKRLVPIQRFSSATVGIMGFGRMGQEVARKLAAFHVKIIAYDPVFNEEAAKRLNVEQVDFDTLLKNSDYLTIHCPATGSNTGIMNDEVFAKMKNTAYLINTARGAIVDQKALVKALRDGQIAGAGIDVYETEPIDKDDPLLKLNNVILSEHSAWYSETAIENLHVKAAKEVIHVLKGNLPFNLCNKEVLESDKIKSI